MNNTIRIIMLAMLAGALLLLAGCGGSSSPATTIIAGTASKGLIYPGSVSVFAVDAAGFKTTIALNTVVTDSNGRFSADIGVYSGAVVIEVTGMYTDEAKGTAVALDVNSPMRAAIDAVSPTTKRFAVTPLTDLAYNLAGTLTAQNIAAANARVSGLFKISDITTVEPVQPIKVAMSAATISQQTYTLALAALSQMAKNNNPSTAAAFSQIDTILNSFKADLDASASAGLITTNVNAFTSALGTMTSGPLKGFDAAAAALSSVGTNSLKLTITTSGIPNGTLIGGIQGKITFPVSTNVRLDPAPKNKGEVLSGLFILAGNAAASLPANSFVAPAFTFGIIYGNGFIGGDIATLTVDVASGSPTPASFSLSNLSVIDTAGAAIPGAAVTLK